MSDNGKKSFMRRFWWLFVVIGVIGSGAFVVGQFNGFVVSEKGIEAENSKLENVLGAGFKKIESQGLALDKYKDTFLQALTIGMEGRYGKTGSKAAFQWIQEQHPELPPAVFKALQDAIEVTFSKFEAVQNAKIDKIRVYESNLETFPGNVFASMFGFPRMDLEDAKSVVSSAEAKQVMSTKELSTPSL